MTNHMGLDAKGAIFKARRARFLEAIRDGVAVLPSAPAAVRSNDVDFPYRQDSDFYYLTGFTEPQAVALFAPDDPDGAFVMFVRGRDKERETWTGPRAGIEGAMIDYGADKAYAIDELDHVLPRYLEKVDRVYYPLGLNQAMNERILAMVSKASAMRQRTGCGPCALLDPREIIHEARLVKEPAEIEAMRQAAAISAEAHKRAMRWTRGGMFERQVEALIAYVFRSKGATAPSYPPIVASGSNATILHYTRNDRLMSRGELLLLDAGCEYEFYAADITRTFPVGSRFSASQKAVYEVVLEAQLKAIETVRPGVTLEEVHDSAVRVAAEGLCAIGVFEGPAEKVLADESYRRYYTHRTSHWLGMDVHDVGLYRKEGKPRELKPGMVLTVEPGLYFAADDEGAPERLRGIGIRIEDDVLVTADGCEVLSAAVPKKVEEIEALTAR